jgi:Xaa-Pro aminopeptidase
MKNRIKNIRAKIKKESLDAFLVTDLTNIRYLAGFTGSNALLVVTHKNTVLLTDFRYQEQAKKDAGSCKIIISSGSLFVALYEKGILKTAKTIGFEGTNLVFNTVQQIKKLFKPIKFIPFDNFIEDIAVQKDESEIAATKKAIEISDKVFSEIVETVTPGMTELDVSAEISYRIKKLGAEKESFKTIVASGVNSSMPHAEPTNKKLKNNEPLLIDFGATVHGYRSDMTRTLFLGNISPKFIEIYNIVLNAQNIAIEHVKSGISCSDLDGIARDYIANSGYGDFFKHSLGHGVGLKIHQKPVISAISKDVLKENMIITVEPGIYLPNRYGVRIEDNILVQKTGYKNLTKSPKDLIVL